MGQKRSALHEDQNCPMCISMSILPLVAGVEVRLEFMAPRGLSHFFPHCPLRGAQEKPGELPGLSSVYRCPGKATQRKRPGPAGWCSHNLIHFVSQHATNLWGYRFAFTKKKNIKIRQAIKWLPCLSSVTRWLSCFEVAQIPPLPCNVWCSGEEGSPTLQGQLRCSRRAPMGGKGLTRPPSALWGVFIHVWRSLLQSLA